VSGGGRLMSVCCEVVKFGSAIVWALRHSGSPLHI
jgi:hypothetical protein